MPEVSSEEEMAAVFEESSLKNFENRASITDLNTVLKTLESLNDQRIINLFKLRYDTNKRKRRTWSEIGKELRVSVQTAIQLHKKGLRLIRMEISDKKLDVFKDLAIF